MLQKSTQRSLQGYPRDTQRSFRDVQRSLRDLPEISQGLSEIHREPRLLRLPRLPRVPGLPQDLAKFLGYPRHILAQLERAIKEQLGSYLGLSQEAQEMGQIPGSSGYPGHPGNLGFPRI